MANVWWARCSSSAKTWMRNAHEREREKTTSLDVHSFWQRVKGKLPRYYFSLSRHEAEAGKGRGFAARCVRQQVRLGLPCQEVGRACGFLSYLWEGWSTAAKTDIQWAAKRKERANTEDENASTALPLLTSFIHSVCAHESIACMCVCVVFNACTHIHTPHIPKQPRVRWLVRLNQYTSQWKCVKLRKRCFTDDCGPLTSRDTPPRGKK